MNKLQNQLVPLLIILIGVSCWLAGNMINDKENGLNLALTLVGVGGGLARQNSESTVETDNIENVDIDNRK